jgi:hypothetical protein
MTLKPQRMLSFEWYPARAPNGDQLFCMRTKNVRAMIHDRGFCFTWLAKGQGKAKSGCEPTIELAQRAAQAAACTIAVQEHVTSAQCGRRTAW